MEVKIEASWLKILEKEFDKEYFSTLNSFLQEERINYNILPDESQVYRAFNECSFSQVKVVILGQDPYPTSGHAHGLCFSCDASVKPLPKSLKNIFKEYKTDLGIDIPDNGDLNHWAKQGVLMLNTVLTVREGDANSHANNGWEEFTDKVIEKLNEHSSNIVYILWGAKAQKKAKNVDASQNLILNSPHPSPLSSYRGFFGSKPFSKANDYLQSKGKGKINW